MKKVKLLYPPKFKIGDLAWIFTIVDDEITKTKFVSPNEVLVIGIEMLRPYAVNDSGQNLLDANDGIRYKVIPQILIDRIKEPDIIEVCSGAIFKSINELIKNVLETAKDSEFHFI